jgi:hypothetical protein
VPCVSDLFQEQENRKTEKLLVSLYPHAVKLISIEAITLMDQGAASEISLVSTPFISQVI